MKVVIQRVTQGCIKDNGEIITSIGKGLLVLVGISQNDTVDDLNYITKKILNVRFFEDENGKKWAKNVMDKQYEVLCMSQFTLCYNLKGNRLDFHHAMHPDDAIKFYDNFLESLRKQYKPDLIKNGKFGSYYHIALCNDGPVTIHLESKSSAAAESGDAHSDCVPVQHSIGLDPGYKPNMSCQLLLKNFYLMETSSTYFVNY